MGWPADTRTYGGSFLYHLDGDRVALGYVSGLDYADPNYAPYEAFQQWKHHPLIKPLLEGGSILSAGARAIVTGGWQSLPKVEMPGALLIGDTAGLLNVPKIKGTHQAIRSGMLAAEHLAQSLDSSRLRRQAARIGRDGRAEESPQHQARLQARHVVRDVERRVGNRDRRAFAVDAEEQARLVVAGQGSARTKQPQARLRAPRPGPARPPRRRLLRRHRTRRGPAGAPRRRTTPRSASPAAPRNTTIPAPASARPASTRSSTTPADGSGKRLQINAANCVHCKTCDIKDPYEIITWVTPEGGAGPNYQNLYDAAVTGLTNSTLRDS